ncbi:MAG: hypothetical protein ACXWGV_10675, partial [Solirubrobacterales bacterium]
AGASELARVACERGCGPSRMVVLEQLGGPDERIVESAAGAWGERPAGALHAVALECRGDPGAAWLPRTAGLPDDAYEHDGQITKRAIRALTLAVLAPAPGQLLWDIGAGSGSIGIEWLRSEPLARAIAIEARADDPAEARAQVITDRRALAEVSAERAVVAALGATCDTPVGAHAEIGSGRMTLCGFCGLPDGSEWVRDEVTDDASEPEELGRRLAERMRAAGAAELLERAEQMAAGKAAGR